LVFDCGRLNHLSSTGIGAFNNILKVLGKINGEFVICSLQPKVENVMKLLGCMPYFTVRKDFLEAVDYFVNPVQKKEIFPATFSCPLCSKKLKAPRAGHFRCSKCKGVLGVDKQGEVYFG
jgi:hypothetical protein